MVYGQSGLVKGCYCLSNQPKIALAGCGYWGKNLCRNFHELGALAQVVDATENGKSTARSIAPEVAVTSNFEEVLNNPEIKGIALATPAETHCDLAVQAMEKGKDVFVEKPMALTLEDAEKVQAVAFQTNKVLMVGHLLEYHPAVLKLRELIDSEELGKINYIYSNRLNFGKVRTEENALWSFAPHDVAVILRLMGQSPTQVSATGGSYLTSGLADTTVSNLRFSDESRAHIFVSWLHPFKELLWEMKRWLSSMMSLPLVKSLCFTLKPSNLMVLFHYLKKKKPSSLTIPTLSLYEKNVSISLIASNPETNP